MTPSDVELLRKLLERWEGRPTTTRSAEAFLEALPRYGFELRGSRPALADNDGTSWGCPDCGTKVTGPSYAPRCPHCGKPEMVVQP